MKENMYSFFHVLINYLNNLKHFHEELKIRNLAAKLSRLKVYAFSELLYS